MMEKTSYGPVPRRSTLAHRAFHTTTTLLAIILLFDVFIFGNSALRKSIRGPENTVVEQVQKCAIKNLHKNTSFLDSARPITADEFVQRRDRLAQALVASDVDAFVLEPGYTFQYAAQLQDARLSPD